VVDLDFVRIGPSHMHCCRAFSFALAGLFLFQQTITGDFDMPFLNNDSYYSW